VSTILNAYKCSACTPESMDDIIAKVPSKVVGVAKDGHVIYGAVKSGSISSQNAELYTACELDGCNGVITTVGEGDAAEKVYTYRATTFHPYLVGCFGPSDMPTGAILG